MIHIIEGVDLAGKSTIASDLQKELGCPIVKKKLGILEDYDPKFLEGVSIEVFTQMFWESIAPLGRSCNFILDRGLISSVVYTHYYNRKYDISYIYDYIFKDNDFFKIYYVTCSDKTLLERYNTRGENYFSFNQLLLLKNIYEGTISSIITQLAIDKSPEQINKIIEVIEND